MLPRFDPSIYGYRPFIPEVDSRIWVKEVDGIEIVFYQQSGQSADFIIIHVGEGFPRPHLRASVVGGADLATEETQLLKLARKCMQ